MLKNPANWRDCLTRETCPNCGVKGQIHALLDVTDCVSIYIHCHACDHFERHSRDIYQAGEKPAYLKKL